MDTENHPSASEIRKDFQDDFDLMGGSISQPGGLKPHQVFEAKADATAEVPTQTNTEQQTTSGLVPVFRDRGDGSFEVHMLPPKDNIATFVTEIRDKHRPTFEDVMAWINLVAAGEIDDNPGVIQAPIQNYLQDTDHLTRIRHAFAFRKLATRLVDGDYANDLKLAETIRSKLTGLNLTQAATIADLQAELSGSKQMPQSPLAKLWQSRKSTPEHVSADPLLERIETNRIQEGDLPSESVFRFLEHLETIDTSNSFSKIGQLIIRLPNSEDLAKNLVSDWLLHDSTIAENIKSTLDKIGAGEYRPELEQLQGQIALLDTTTLRDIELRYGGPRDFSPVEKEALDKRQKAVEKLNQRSLELFNKAFGELKIIETS